VLPQIASGWFLRLRFVRDRTRANLCADCAVTRVACTARVHPLAFLGGLFSSPERRVDVRWTGSQTESAVQTSPSVLYLSLYLFSCSSFVSEDSNFSSRGLSRSSSLFCSVGHTLQFCWLLLYCSFSALFPSVRGWRYFLSPSSSPSSLSFFLIFGFSMFPLFWFLFLFFFSLLFLILMSKKINSSAREKKVN
jgi:hypothetical protein